MLVRGKPRSALPRRLFVFASICISHGRTIRFAALSLEPKHASIVLRTRSYHEGTLKVFFLQMQGFDMSFEVRFTQEALIAVFWIR